MRVKVNGKNITVPDAVIEQGFKEGLTRQESVDRFLSDEGIAMDATVAELTQKAKAAGTGAKATGEKKERKAPVRKPDEIKRMLIGILNEFLVETPDIEAVEVTNVERMIAFQVRDEKFELTLTKKRKPKE
jgi:hypothetical protein